MSKPASMPRPRALTHGLSHAPHRAQHPRACHCPRGLTDLRRVCPALDPHRSPTLRECALRRRPDPHRLRARRDHQRSPPNGVPLGAICPDQGRGQDAHAPRFAREHSFLPSSISATANCTACARIRDQLIPSQRVLPPRPGLRRLYRVATAGRLLSSSAPAQTSKRAAAIRTGWTAARPIRDQTAVLMDPGLELRFPHGGAADPLHRSTSRGSAGVLDQSLRAPPALTITELYGLRRQSELCFSRSSSTCASGSSSAPRRTRQDADLDCDRYYVLVAIVKKRLGSPIPVNDAR
jgi:hypothetical protein